MQILFILFMYTFVSLLLFYAVSYSVSLADQKLVAQPGLELAGG